MWSCSYCSFLCVVSGLFTGTFVSLFIIYSVLAHVAGIFSSTGNTAYMEIVYHVFRQFLNPTLQAFGCSTILPPKSNIADGLWFCSMFALISLHVFLYGCNLFMWKSTRINHNFIFDFSSSTALTHRDAFLMSASIMCTVVAALVINLFLRNAGATYANALPGALLLVRNTGHLENLFCCNKHTSCTDFSPPQPSVSVSAVSRGSVLPIQHLLPLDALLFHACHAQHHTLAILQGKGLGI